MSGDVPRPVSLRHHRREWRQTWARISAAAEDSELVWRDPVDIEAVRATIRKIAEARYGPRHYYLTRDAYDELFPHGTTDPSFRLFDDAPTP